ncbi:MULTISPECIES: acyloxyacyl hydrolase [unclassified Achromobacter]|uniref:acyloxyacyl hydrolase n=1 Tax=unclassified Achromobacter TaxID=2626865 RepID=UPI000B51E112|nr:MULTISPECIES: acyloxyacyl hydrolase [unclassified Achromobacter]OWT77515.1 hypothetical protein CEY04_16360 [Achromobacter sp. HZ28]OWT78396.1 hypothetical protein CEY05_10855 [Achromobacter sp. HZ34]
MQSGYKKSLVAGALAALAMACAVPAAQAQDKGGISVQGGFGDSYNRGAINYETAPLWQTSGSLGRLDLTGELGVAYWWAHSGGGHPSTAWQLNAIPMFRWWVTDRFFFEGGVGPTVFNRTKFADETISTAFQFGDHIGFGYQFDQHNRISLRYSHFSNASIKTPNPGLDVTNLTYTYLF